MHLCFAMQATAHDFDAMKNEAGIIFSIIRSRSELRLGALGGERPISRGQEQA